MKLFGSIVGYLFLSGMFAGAMINKEHRECSTYEISDELIEASLKWPWILGVALTKSADIPSKEYVCTVQGEGS